MKEPIVDFITSLDGYASAEGWPGWWGLEGQEYLAWLGEQPDATLLMGAKTYRLMSGMAAGEFPDGTKVPTTNRVPPTSSHEPRSTCSPPRSPNHCRGRTPHWFAATPPTPYES